MTSAQTGRGESGLLFNRFLLTKPMNTTRTEILCRLRVSEALHPSRSKPWNANATRKVHRRIRKRTTSRSSIKNKESAGDIPIRGELQRILERGEYVPFTTAPVFESHFVQVNRRGESIYLHNRPNYVIMGICPSNRKLALPNMLLLANSTLSFSQDDIRSSISEDDVVLTRFIPLKFVDITVHSAKDRRFKLKLVSGRSFYLQLCAPRQKQSSIFYQWFRIINLLKSTNSEINFLPRDFDTRTKNRGIRNRSSKMNADQGKNQLEPSVNEQDSEETANSQIVKQSSSKRVTISDIVAPIEDFQKSQSQSTLSSISFIRRFSGNARKQNSQISEVKSNIAKTSTREQDASSMTRKRLQTSGILKNVTNSDIIYNDKRKTDDISRPQTN